MAAVNVCGIGGCDNDKGGSGGLVMVVEDDNGGSWV